MALAFVLIALGVLVVAWLASGIRVVHADHRAVIERFGRYRRTVGPGLRLTLRLVHTFRLVDERETVADISTDVLTADDVTLGMDVAVFTTCTDPRRFVYDVGNFSLALARLTETHLRSLARQLTLDEVLNEADRLTVELARSLEEVAQTWGVGITRVEMARVQLPSEVVEAMNGRAAADLYHRAIVTEEVAAVEAGAIKAEGEHQARLRRCEVKQTVLLMNAEREAAAERILADAERYRQQAMARAEAEVIRIVSGAIQHGWVGSELPALKYLEVQGSDRAASTEGESSPLPPPLPDPRGSVAGLEA